MVFYALGYRFNQNEGSIEQGALLQFSSIPRGANVQLDGLPVNGRTPARNTSVAGSHHVSYHLDGYRDWSKSFNVGSGDVLWLDYARMIPNDIQTASVAKYDSLNDMLVSPSSDYVALQEKSTDSDIDILDMRKDEVSISTLSLPSKVFTKPAKKSKQAFKIDSWSPDSNYLLIEHTFDKKHEWILVKRNDAKSAKNLTTLFGVDAKSMVMASSNAIYAKIDNDIRLLTVSKETISRPLVKNVSTYDYHGGVLSYSTNIDKKTHNQSVGYYDSSSDKSINILNFKDKSIKKTDIVVGQYYHKQYVAIAANNAVDIYTGDLPKSSSDKSLKKLSTISLKDGSVKWLNFSPGSQYIYAQDGEDIIGYDLATDVSYSTTIKGKTDIQHEIKWIDKHMMWSDRDNMLRFYDFDGANQQDITPVARGYDVAVSSNNKYVYSVAKEKSGDLVLQRSKLIIDNE